MCSLVATPTDRNSHRMCSKKIGIHKTLQNVQKNTCAGVFINNVAGLRLAIFLKRRLQHKRFCVNFVKYLRIPFCTEYPQATASLSTFDSVPLYSYEEVVTVLVSLRASSPNTEFFLIRIFMHSDWIRTATEYLSVFSPNTGKYGPEKTPYLDTFHTVQTLAFFFSITNITVKVKS